MPAVKRLMWSITFRGYGSITLQHAQLVALRAELQRVHCKRGDGKIIINS